MKRRIESRHGKAAAASLDAFEEIIHSIAFAGEEPVLETVVPLLRELLESDQALAYRFDHQDGGLDVDFAHTSGLGPKDRLLERARAYFSRTRGQITAYRLPIPAPAERNAVFLLGSEQAWEVHRSLPIVRDLYPQLGLDGQDQLRVLICDGPHLLAWVGGFRQQMFGIREAERLQMVTGALVNRLKLEESLRRLSLRGAALDLTMDALGAPAFILDKKGRVAHANQAGEALPPDQRAAIVEKGRMVRAGRLPADQSLSLLGIDAAGLPPHTFLLQRAPPSAEQKLALFVKRFDLSPRQGQVLRELVEGRSNKAIGAALGIREGTVELHLTNIFLKVGVESRAELAAAFWSG